MEKNQAKEKNQTKVEGLSADECRRDDEGRASLCQDMPPDHHART
jgi:hypothetical protein